MRKVDAIRLASMYHKTWRASDIKATADVIYGGDIDKEYVRKVATEFRGEHFDYRSFWR